MGKNILPSFLLDQFRELALGRYALYHHVAPLESSRARQLIEATVNATLAFEDRDAVHAALAADFLAHVTRMIRSSHITNANTLLLVEKASSWLLRVSAPGFHCGINPH